MSQEKIDRLYGNIVNCCPHDNDLNAIPILPEHFTYMRCTEVEFLNIVKSNPKYLFVHYKLGRDNAHRLFMYLIDKMTTPDMDKISEAQDGEYIVAFYNEAP